ncbi:MAG: beta strand repeat-containing protein [Lachnospiraceae bacterium]
MRQQTGKNQSWRKNWEKKWKTGWIKHAAAVGLAASMAVTTPLSVLAENTTNIEQNETVTAAFTADSTAAAETNNQSEISNQEETNHQKEINNQGEVNNQDSTAAEEPSKEEVQLSLQLVAVEADTTKPSLKLDAAVKLSGKLKVNTSDDGTKTIEVTDGEGLIMLSNVEPKDYKNCTIKLVTTSGWNLTTPVTPTKANETSGTTGTDGTGEVAGTQYHFLGLGDTANPYEGKFMFDKDTSANNYSISTTRSLFNALSTTATLENMIPFSIDKENYTSTEPLLAAALKAGISDSAGDQSTKTTLKCNIALRNIDAEDISSETTIGGLIGTMEANTSADITFTNQFSKELNVSGTSHVGLFCNTMESGASLTATYTKDSGAGKISVKTTSSNNDAGGFVGHMEKNTSLTIAGTSVDKVSAASGNAGGIVGSATDGTISLKTETTAEGTNDPTTFTFADVLLSAGSEKAVGGLIGAYSVTSERNGTPINFDLSQYRFKSITVTGGKDVGGLFGALKNTSTISATVTVSGKTTSAITTNVTNETGVTNLGGLIGTYDTVESTDPNSEKVMKNTLAIKGDSNTAGSFIAAATTGGSKANTTYGGVIGSVSGSSYVEIENVSASIADMKNSNNTSVGGLVGKMNDGFLNVGSVKLATTGDNDLGKAAEKKAAGADNVEGHGGLVGHLVKGVLRLHGKTNLSEQKITTAYNHVGQIVGFNENGLIYALGNGNNLDSYGSGWSLTRYSGADRGGSDIGNWGAVVRLGDMLMEGNDGALTFDDQAHTVTVNNGTDENVNNTNAFAAYALAFVFANTDTGKTEALKVKKDVKRDDKQTVTLTGDVDLTGTGIIGIGKDNIEKDKSAQKFTGTLDGGGNTITLDIGTPYGNDISARNNNAAGQLYAKRSDQRDTHYSLALIPFAGDVTISNLTIAGNVNCKIPKTVNQEEKEIKYPAFVASAIGCASGTTEFNSVIVNTKVSVEEESDAKKLLTWQGGFLARCEGNTLSFTNCKWEDSASLDDERDTDNHRIGGLAAEVMGGCTVTVKDCTLSGSIKSKSTANANVGGLIAVSRGEDSNNNSKPSTINISNLQVNGENVTTSAATTSGGLLGYQWKNTNVEFATAGNTGNADVGTSAAQSGVTISGSTLNVNTAQFGGLVYQASGYWNATAKYSIVFATAGENASDMQQTGTNSNTFKGKSVQDTPSGLLVGTGLITETKETNTTTAALYLEVGTWGEAADAAYKINSGAVTLDISNSDYFDELVGITISDNAGNNNAVVSLAVRDSNGKAVCIDKGTNTNTYTGQLDSANYKNGKTRYYYNLDSYRKDKYTTDLKIINTVEDLVLWSAAQYAAENIRTCFRKEITSTPENLFITSISGDLNLDGYSYYPVTPLTIVHIGSENENDTENKTTLTFAYDTMNTIEGTNKQFSDSGHQHYLMQHGLLYNTSHGILVNQTAFVGVVGKELIKKADGTENKTQYNSGALIYGSVIGNPISNIVGITLKNVTLDGIMVTGVEKGKDTYAPLLINRIAKAATLIVNNLSTSDKYMTVEGTNKTTAYAATSLIGSVGSDTASKLTLSFSNIALDGRVSEDSAKSTSVQNNGENTVEYNTTHTIFTRATLMEYFMYSSDGSGTYNFNSTDDKVTYGVELTNAGTSGRNPDKQYQYYDADSYITDEKDKTDANVDYVKARYSSDKFLRYVYVVQDINNSKYELDINQRSTGLLKGCGTYGDPYIIENALQLSSLAAYISTPGSVSKFQAVFNSKVLESQQQTAESYHTQNATTNATGRDITYTWQNNAWKAETTDNATESADSAVSGIDKKTATKYLLNAYYKIEKDITISAETFSGLGTLTNPFSGVIIGNTSDANQPVTVHITKTNANKDSFGGLIAYSRGSVVKDLTVDYSQAAIKMNADTCPGTLKNPFFGGVVGYCMGGDTVIDHVSVNYSASTVSFGGTYQELIAAGGYVGLVGGATNVTEKSDYEKTGGGVVFRNMTGTTNTFTTLCAEAAAGNKTVNMEDVDANNKAGKLTTAGGNYFYRNPYVGRVLDGYACAEGCTINNTDKNYTIPTLNNAKNDLQVTEENGILTATVTSAQGLWLLSAIVNSGAGAMDSTGSYTDVDNNVVDAYQYGKPRTASYDGIGEAATDATVKLADEAYWGGNASTAGSDDAKARVSYLVKNYTTDTTAARLAGKSSGANTTTNFPVNLTFSADSIDMRDYGNGFRGIGCSYGENKEVWNTDCSIPKVYRRSLQIKSINDKKTSATTITLNMNQSSYDRERTNGSWCSQGAGLFVDFHFTDNCTVNNLIISGKVKLGLFNDNSLTYMSKVSGHAVGVGGFAARTANSTGTVTFNNFSLYTMNVYGGTMTGGAIGYIDGYNKAQRNVTFNNWSIKNANVSKWVDNDGSAGGLVGWNIGYGTLEIKRDSNEDVNISNLKVTTISSVCNVAAAGGLVGACDYSGVSISNVNAEYLTVTGKLVRDIGGLIAGERNKNNKNVSVKNCVLHNVNVDNNITNKTESRTGGIIGYHEERLTISSVKLEENSKINGQQYTGGFVGESNAVVIIDDCSEKNVSVKSDTKNWVGGFIGHLGKKATFTNCQQENVTVLGRYVGGLVGAADGDMQASNIEFQNVIVATNKGEKDSRNTGLLTGSTNILNKNISVKGYNILAQSCEVGYANGASNLLTADIKPMDTAGFWIGESGPKDTINLTAVSAFGIVFPQKDIGKQSGSATMATIIYADAAADKNYNPTDSAAKPSSSANPWLDVNPKSNVPFADGTVMTGNAVGAGKTETETGTASAILTELGKTSHASAYYWNVDNSTKDDVAKLLVSTNDAYLTTYRAEESATTTVSENVDFPVLVVNNSAEVDTLLWNFIAAMTNVKNGETAKEQVKDITATTYKWNSTIDTDDTNNTNSTFIAQDKASLTVSSSKKISITPNAYDNQSSQFTLLDVTYEDPTDSTHAFHLYIPVLVKKVLYINFKTRFIAGTDYCASDYPMTDTSPNHYATAGFNEPVTAYMEYRYEKETDWQSMLDNGENLLWYYDKILDLASGSTSAVGTPLLPAGTRLTLVDRQTMQYYTYTTTGKEDFHKFKLTDMTAPGTDSASFAPVFICDLLELKAEEASNPTDGATYYVQETDHSKATVRVGADYYRKATDDDVKDSKVKRYKITVPSENGKPIVKERTESYYLTIQIPDTKDLSIVNNRLYAATMSRKEGTLPAVIKSDKTTDSSAYVVYNGVQQSLTISTSRIHNGSDTGDTAMENGDGIKISLTSKLWLTEAGKSQFKSLGPSEVYHEFDVSLKKYLKEAAGISDVIGTENITYTYTVAKSDNESIVTKEGRISGIAGKDTLTLQYGSAELKKALESAETENSAVTVTAVIMLTYDGADKFPVRDTAVTSDNSGTSVVGVSRIANTSTQLPITENKKTDENQNRYYVTNPSKAKLTYSSVNVDPNVTSDTTQQLGVNPWDTVNNRSDMIYTRADYDYSNVDAAVLNNANKIRYKMELFQKNATGSYDETKPLPIKDYLQNTVKENGSTEASTAGSSETSGTGTVYQWEESFKSDDGRHQIARFQYAPLTGEAFEKKGYTYANYRVRLTAVLLDEKGNELDGTKATDYIIYTNARISQEIMQQQQ